MIRLKKVCACVFSNGFDGKQMIVLGAEGGGGRGDGQLGSR